MKIPKSATVTHQPTAELMHLGLNYLLLQSPSGHNLHLQQAGWDAKKWDVVGKNSRFIDKLHRGSDSCPLKCTRGLLVIVIDFLDVILTRVALLCLGVEVPEWGLPEDARVEAVNVTQQVLRLILWLVLSPLILQCRGMPFGNNFSSENNSRVRLNYYDDILA